MSVVITNQPDGEPVSLDDAKGHLGVTDDAHDNLLTGLITGAVSWCESYTGRVFIRRSAAFRIDGWPLDGVIRTPIPPLISVESIGYLDSNGEQQVLPVDQYRVDTASVPGRITPAYGVSWPTVRAVPDAITVTLDAGYGLTEESKVPEGIRAAILLHVQKYFDRDDREGSYLDAAIESLLNQYRVY